MVGTITSHKVEQLPRTKHEIMHKTAQANYSNRCSTCLISISGHPAERARCRQMDSFEKQSQVDELFKKELIVAIFCNRDHLP
jgi:hypothetical protein